MRDRLARVAPAFHTEVQDAIANSRLDETFVNALCQPASHTYGGMIAHVLTFAAHNRTLAVLALKKAGVEDTRLGRPMRSGDRRVDIEQNLNADPARLCLAEPGHRVKWRPDCPARTQPTGIRWAAAG